MAKTSRPYRRIPTPAWNEPRVAIGLDGVPVDVLDLYRANLTEAFPAVKKSKK